MVIIYSWRNLWFQNLMKGDILFKICILKLVISMSNTRLQRFANNTFGTIGLKKSRWWWGHTPNASWWKELGASNLTLRTSNNYLGFFDPNIWRWGGSTIVGKTMINEMKLIGRLHGKVLENVGQTLKDNTWCMERERMFIGFK
jgi:hypothetical protein